MSDLINVVVEDIVYLLKQEPFSYIVASFMVYVSVEAIFFIIKGGDKKC